MVGRPKARFSRISGFSAYTDDVNARLGVLSMLA